MHDSEIQVLPETQDSTLSPEIQPLPEISETPSKLSRRFFLGASAGAAGAAAAALVQPSPADASLLGQVKKRLKKHAPLRRDSLCQPPTTAGSVTDNTTACSAANIP
jgi:hypothetical protein